MKHAAYDDLSIYAIADTAQGAIERARSDANDPGAAFMAAPISDAFAARIERDGWDGKSQSFEVVNGQLREVRRFILAAIEHDRDGLLDGVRHLYNCREANVDGEGRIWIMDPQHGHWLDDDGLNRVDRALEAGDI